jgi:hypothetical protein
MTRVHVITHRHLMQQHSLYLIITELESLQNYMRPYDKNPFYATHAHGPDWLDLDDYLLLFSLPSTYPAKFSPSNDQIDRCIIAPVQVSVLSSLNPLVPKSWGFACQTMQCHCL